MLTKVRLFFISLKNPALAGFFALALLTLSLVAMSGCDLLSYNTKSKVVLKVENKSMTLNQFSVALAQRLKDLDPLSAKDPQVLKTFKQRITTDFLIDAFAEKWFSDQKLSIDPVLLEKELKQTIEQYPSDFSFRESLAQQNLSYQDWRKAVETGLKRKALFDSLRKDLPKPSEAELEAYYQNNKIKYFQAEAVFAQSILIKDENQADVIKKLYRRTSFEKLFKDYSLEKSNPQALQFGWVERLNGSALEALFSAKKTELVGPIQLSEGYRLFKVTQRRPSYQRKFEDVRTQVLNEVVALRESARFSAWLDEQIKHYKVYRNLAAIDALVVETRPE